MIWNSISRALRPHGAILGLLLVVCPLQAAERPQRRIFLRISQVALVVAEAVDAQSSWGKLESNPRLGRGEFGARQAGIKFGMMGGMLVIQEFVGRCTHHRADKVMGAMNLATAATTGVIAARNYHIPKTK